MALKDKLIAGIEEYTGRKVKDIKVHPDPKVAGTYAIRATLEPKKKEPVQVDFMIVGSYMDKPIPKCTPEEISENLEEITTDVWPPKSGPLRFFT